MTRRTTRHALSLALLLVLAVGIHPAAVEAQYVYNQSFGRNKVQWRQFDWRIYHSTHFDVYYYPEEESLLQKVVSFAESAYDQLSQEFQTQIQEPVPLIFYDTHAAFEQNNIILNFIPEGIGAFATPGQVRMVLPVDLPDPELMELILHELTHVFQFKWLFGGRSGKALAARPPQWFTEGMASYFAEDESARDKGFLRDAVVNDRIPPLTQAGNLGFFGYRFGHAFFEYVEDRWGEDGLRDLLLEIRGGFGSSVGRALERTFRVEPEDFDDEFRRWLRRKYLPELVETGEPGDFGRPFRLGRTIFTQQTTSPAASPSGDLVAAFTTYKGDVDIVLFDGRERRVLRNLTKGYRDQFEYLVAQEMPGSVPRKMGRDLNFSPDGNQLAFFARHGAGRDLVLLDVLRKKVVKVLPVGVSQPTAPAWSPQGNEVAFAGYKDGRFDIFKADVSTGEVSAVTSDEIYDAAPTYSPDGSSLVITSVVGGRGKLFRIDLADPSQRTALTKGDSNDTDAIHSPDGDTVYFTSDRSGSDNIYSLDLETGEVRQLTNALTTCHQPTVMPGDSGKNRLAFTCFWKGKYDLYLLDLEEPITSPEVVVEAEEAQPEKTFDFGELPRFEPSIEVTLDDSNVDSYKPFKFFLEDADALVGVSDDQTVIGQAILQFSNYLGDRRLIAAFQSIEQFRNFDVIYADLSRRLQWQLRLFDDADFFVARDAVGDIRRVQTALQQTGLVASLVYPFSTSHRVQLGAGYIFRELDFQSFADVPLDDLTIEELEQIFPELVPFMLGELPPDELDALLMTIFPTGLVSIPIITPRQDDYPIITASLVGDTTSAFPWGPVSGRRYRLGADWAPDTEDSGTLTSTLSLDFRQYVPLSARSNLAFRVWGAASDGNFPNPLYIGGLDTVRGFDFRSLVGDRAFFTNLELRFPLIDQLATPFLAFGSIRGVIFLDVGGAWFDEFQDFDLWDSENDRLGDAVSAYGWGITFRFFGLDWNFDFAKRWDFDSSDSDFESSFWIGRRF